MPKVSICLPNLNTRAFLPERLATIFAQTFSDWELVVVDNYSEDGAAEYLIEQAKREPRMRFSQAPREGMYANWNNCVRLSQGEYIYIATSDDTMMPACLERMVESLERNPDCEIAHCKLLTIDRTGAPVPQAWENSFITQFFGDWMERPHVRMAPHDGLLYCAERCVYTSITQLLIRRRLFDRIGPFRTDFDSEGDWEWEMRASLLVNTVHVPETLASWRVHPEQATKIGTRAATAAWHEAASLMMRLAVEAACRLNPSLSPLLDMRKMTFFARRNLVRTTLRERRNAASRLKVMFQNPDVLCAALANRLLPGRKIQDDFAWARQLIAETSGSRPLIRPL